MLFGKYHIVIFREKSGASKNVRLRGWFVITLCLLVVGLAAGNIWFLEHYKEKASLESRLAEADRLLEERNSQLVGMVGQIASLQDDLKRVQGFDAKLRLMMNIERELENTALGGSRSEDFSRSYLPMHRQELMVRKMNNFLKQLSQEILLEEVRQQDLLRTLRSNKEMLASIPSIWPVEGFISSRFGNRTSPFTGRVDFHKGLDISAKNGTPIYAPSKGLVIFAGVDGAYGNCLVLQHGGGIVTRYAHMQRGAVKKGEQVQRGEIIGYVGSTGRSTGPHLHYEVKLNGVDVDPLRYILN